MYKLATQLEKEKLLEEQKQYKEAKLQKKKQSEIMTQAIESYYKDKITILKEKIEAERFERTIAKNA